jgi:hypothetical protein
MLKRIYTQSLPEFCFSASIEAMSARFFSFAFNTLSIYESHLLDNPTLDTSAQEKEVTVTQESVTLIDPLSYVYKLMHRLTRIIHPARGQACEHLQAFDLENMLICSVDLETRLECPCCGLSMSQGDVRIDARFMGWLRRYGEDVESIVIDENGGDRIEGAGKEDGGLDLV